MIQEQVNPDDVISIRELAEFIDPLYDLSGQHCDKMLDASAKISDLKEAMNDFFAAAEKLKDKIEPAIKSLKDATKVSTELALHLASVLPTQLKG